MPSSVSDSTKESLGTVLADAAEEAAESMTHGDGQILPFGNNGDLGIGWKDSRPFLASNKSAALHYGAPARGVAGAGRYVAEDVDENVILNGLVVEHLD